MKKKRRKSLVRRMSQGMVGAMLIVAIWGATSSYQDARNQAKSDLHYQLASAANRARAALGWLCDPHAPPSEGADSEAVRQRVIYDLTTAVDAGDTQRVFLLQTYDAESGTYVETARSGFVLSLLMEDETFLYVPLEGLPEDEVARLYERRYKAANEKTITVRGQLRGEWLYPSEIVFTDEPPFRISEPMPQDEIRTAVYERWDFVAYAGGDTSAVHRAYALQNKLDIDWEKLEQKTPGVYSRYESGGTRTEYWVVERFEDLYRFDGVKMRLTLATDCNPSKIARDECAVLLIYLLGLGPMLAFIQAKSISDSIFPRLADTAQQARHIATLDFEAFSPDLDAQDEIGDLNRTLKEMADTLHEKWDTERDLERRRQEFVAAASHDLKTPLALIGGYAEAVSQDISPEDNARYLASIEREAERMNALVREMLDYTKLDRMGKLEKHENIDLSSLMNTLLAEMQPAFVGRQVHTQLVENVRLRGDEELLRRALGNVLSNAGQYTPEGGRVMVAVRWERGKPGVEVENEGEHIEAGDLTRIFEMFYRADKARTRDKGGNGVGLAIAQKIFALHGLDIRAENTEAGVKFIIESNR